VVLRTSRAVGKSLADDNRAVLQSIRETVKAPIDVVQDQTFHQERFEISNL